MELWLTEYPQPRPRLNDPDQRWVLKNPSHLAALDAQMAVYPDALVVCTHPRPGDLHRVRVLALGRCHRGHLHDLRRGDDRPHPARPALPVVARISEASGIDWTPEAEVRAAF